MLNEITTLITEPVLKVDNKSALKFIMNPKLHKYSEHIEVLHYYFQKKFKAIELTVEYVASDK